MLFESSGSRHIEVHSGLFRHGLYIYGTHDNSFELSERNIDGCIMSMFCISVRDGVSIRYELPIHISVASVSMYGIGFGILCVVT